jgi:hypothetical protein
MSTITCQNRKRKKCFEKTKKKGQLFSIPKIKTDPDREPTFEQKTDPDRCQKINRAGLESRYIISAGNDMLLPTSSTYTGPAQ